MVEELGRKIAAVDGGLHNGHLKGCSSSYCCHRTDFWYIWWTSVVGTYGGS